MTKKYNYIIGDIHGCFYEFLELEEKIKEHAKANSVDYFIISCGDLIDRGFYSKEVLEHFLEGKNKGTHTTILGNHEVMMLQTIEAFTTKEKLKKELKNFLETSFLETIEQLFDRQSKYFSHLNISTYIQSMKDTWLEAGGLETIKSFGLTEKDFDNYNFEENIIKFLIDSPIFYEDKDFIVTHGISKSKNIHTVLSNKKDNIEELRKAIESVMWGRTPPKEKIHEKLHISGHRVVRQVNNLEIENAFQIDTGCAYGNFLTCYCVEDNSFLQVKAKKAYKYNKVFT
ncbi:MAG: metallophosphoesterase [Candidatus Sericytochromatia bacterium]